MYKKLKTEYSINIDADVYIIIEINTGGWFIKYYYSAWIWKYVTPCPKAKDMRFYWSAIVYIFDEITLYMYM